jgi:hypothetical protein
VIVFSTAAVPTIRRQREKLGPYIGALFTPRHFRKPPEDIPWAADNDGFGGFEPGPFHKMLGTIAHHPGCAFITAPDVVADARATLTEFMRWQPILAALNLPVAYVLQDGLEGVGVPWDYADVIFVGGTTEFKMGRLAAQTCAEAKERGKWVHVGRVNSSRRLEYAHSVGADSVDGSGWWRARDEHKLHMLPYRQTGLVQSLNPSTPFNSADLSPTETIGR